MSDPLKYDPQPAKIGPDAQEELDRLLETAHEHGVLRFANDLIAAKSDVARIIVDSLNGEGSQNVVQNLAVLTMVLSRIEPAQMYRTVFALKDAIERVESTADSDRSAPGITGVYRMLHDESLWRAAKPLLDAMKVFAEKMTRTVEEPSAEFSGKTMQQPRP